MSLPDKEERSQLYLHAAVTFERHAYDAYDAYDTLLATLTALTYCALYSLR